MSLLFYDHIIVLTDLDEAIKIASSNHEEREELWLLVDEIIHHRVIGCIFDHLPPSHHEEFSKKFVKRPHDKKLIDYINKRIQKNIEQIIQKEIQDISEELLEGLALNTN